MSHSLEEARGRALERLRRHASQLAGVFELPLASVDAESSRVRRRYGICYADGRIRIRLHQLREPDLLKYSVMVDTLCHELAHLRHLNHGPRFWKLYRRILAYARRHGIYRPGPEAAPVRVAASFAALPPAIRRAAPRERPRPVRVGEQLELF